ncbi:sulfite exporter TauE/SafE family protein [Sphingomonas kaistensis]|uniref:Probable membrane transporter protein n=1 Tax=Sphingomonas kaistensis TaxID=298708 RepID=A0ABZ2FZU8_9SPHN
MSEIWLCLAGLLAGLINAIAGGGPLLTLAALTAVGIDPRTANLTSTVALCPGQLIAGFRARRALDALNGDGTSRQVVPLLALVGGAIGGLLLLWTPPAGFAAIVPWLVLLATALYAWGGHRMEANSRPRLSRPVLLAALSLSSIYGGYFGGGNSFVVLALLGLAGLGDQDGANAKNAVIACINLGAVLVFVPSGEIAWHAAIAVGLGGVAGSWAGSRLLPAIRPAVLRPFIILCGLFLATWYFAT